MTSVEFGAAMRDMRKEHNRELSDVANALRIRQVYLQAIEDGRFDDLPGSTYAAGFVRAYADYLGLEIDEVMRRYRSSMGNIPAQAALAPPSPMSEARLPTGFILLVAAILAAAAYGGWYYLTIHGQSPAEIVSALPKRISDAVGLGDKSATKSVPPEVMKSSATAPVAAIQPNPIADPVVTASTNNAVAVVEKMSTAESGQPQPVTSAPLATAKLPKTVTVQAPPEKIVVPAPEKVEVIQPLNLATSQVAAVPPQENLESRIVLRASVTSWVELRDVGGKRLLSRLLLTGETYKVPGRSGILFTTGNAGGIDIFVDGQPIAALGPVGAVRRDIAMEPITLLTRKLGQR
jgi:cytoskeleton protein RodZ